MFIYESRSFTEPDRKNFETGRSWIAFQIFYLRSEARTKRRTETKKPDLLKLDRPETLTLNLFSSFGRIGAVEKLSPVNFTEGFHRNCCVYSRAVSRIFVSIIGCPMALIFYFHRDAIDYLVLLSLSRS